MGGALFDADRTVAPKRTWRSCLLRASWRAGDVAMQTRRIRVARWSSHGGSANALYQIAPIPTNLILSFVAEHVLGLPAVARRDGGAPGNAGHVCFSSKRYAPMASCRLVDAGAQRQIERSEGDFGAWLRSCGHRRIVVLHGSIKRIARSRDQSPERPALCTVC
jgi:hypothetical protein